VRAHLARSSIFLGSLAVLLLGWLLSVSVTILSSAMMFNTESLGLSPQVASLLAPACVVGMLCVFLAWAGALFWPVSEPVGEFGTLVGGGAGSESAVRDRISACLRSSGGPYAVDTATQADSVLVDNQSEHAVFMVRAVGSDLFVSWIMWRTRSTVGLLREVFGSARGVSMATTAGTTIAMRELLWHATAAGLEEVPGQPAAPDAVA
jgi:hypothetical protein